MEIAIALAFVREHHRCILATRRADGTPQLSPVVATVDAPGRVVISSRETAIKTLNLRRNPAASICAFTDAFYGGWIQIDGRAEVIALPAAMPALVSYYRSIAGEHPDWDEYKEAMLEEQRVILAITPARAGPTSFG